MWLKERKQEKNSELVIVIFMIYNDPGQSKLLLLLLEPGRWIPDALLFLFLGGGQATDSQSRPAGNNDGLVEPPQPPFFPYQITGHGHGPFWFYYVLFFHPPRPAIDLGILPKVDNEGHRKVIDLVLPKLRETMLDEMHCRKPPRDQVRQSLARIHYSDTFWGANLWYTRKRTVEDLVLHYYYDLVKRTL